MADPNKHQVILTLIWNSSDVTNATPTLVADAIYSPIATLPLGSVALKGLVATYRNMLASPASNPNKSFELNLPV